MPKSSHYNLEYFDWQSSIGKFGGWANLAKFRQYVKPDHHVLDFGCGGGFLLCHLDCEEKKGIEINDAAREQACLLGIDAVASVDEVEDEWADVIVSNNALEHTTHPLRELEALLPKLKPGGQIVFVVPCESIGYTFYHGDRNQHLYSWSPMCLGNLFHQAGFEVHESLPYLHKWPPGYRKLARWGGRPLFDFCARVYARLERSWFQVRLVASRPISTELSATLPISSQQRRRAA